MSFFAVLRGNDETLFGGLESADTLKVGDSWGIAGERAHGKHAKRQADDSSSPYAKGATERRKRSSFCRRCID